MSDASRATGVPHVERIAKRCVALLAILTLAGCLHARKPAATEGAAMIPSSALQEDVRVLQQAYESMHPGLYRYNTPAQMSARFADLRRRFAHDQSLESAYLAFSEFAATIRCGHTYPNFYNQPEAIQDRLFKRSDRVPFHFRWIGDRMIVVRNFSADARLSPGTEILAIDGIPARTILRRLLAIARADGANDAKRRAYLQVLGEDAFEAFDIYLPLYFPEIGSRMRLTARSSDGRTRFVSSVDAVSYADRLDERPREPAKDGPAWTLHEPAPGIAVLDMPTWALYESKWDWRAYLDATFADLQTRGTQTLVIDVRANEGGEDVGDVLLAHLAEHDIAGESFERRVRYRTAPPELVPYLHTWDRSFLDWGDAAVPIDGRFFRLTKYDDGAEGANVIRPRAPHFAGKVYVLVGPTNSSATFQFAQAIKESKLGTLVGQPTGGNQRGINGGAFFFVALPNSHIEMDLPLIGRFPTTERPDAGIAPDVLVRTEPSDIAAGRDVELDWVLREGVGAANAAEGNGAARGRE